MEEDKNACQTQLFIPGVRPACPEERIIRICQKRSAEYALLRFHLKFLGLSALTSAEHSRLIQIIRSSMHAGRTPKMESCPLPTSIFVYRYASVSVLHMIPLQSAIAFYQGPDSINVNITPTHTYRNHYHPFISCI